MKPPPTRIVLLSDSAADGYQPSLRPAPLNFYGPAFGFAFLANMLTLTAAALMYRFADFVTFLGGSELELGHIVGFGMVGSMLMRLAQGVGIDRHGPRGVWLLSLAMFAASMLGHLFVSQPNHIAIFVLQALYRTSLAGVFGASFTYVSRSLPVEGMARAIGTLGTAGMLGMFIGPVLGDFLSQSGASIATSPVGSIATASGAPGAANSIACFWLPRALPRALSSRPGSPLAECPGLKSDAGFMSRRCSGATIPAACC